jgi:hypothetical protein|tara:strand:+ start:968 stop:1558 length:591 start_codon:yes stop_codon:yes gene_type:complete
MDEFAELEQELLRTETSSDTSLQEVLNLLNKGKLKVDYTIFLEDKTYTPAKKCGLLALGVILMAMILPMALGVLLIRFIIKLGPLWSTTRHITCRNYLGFYHSILEYEYKNEQIVEAKLTKLDSRSYVSITSVDSGDHGSRDVFALHVGNSGFKDFWPAGSIKNNYQNVKDFCKISGVKLAISPSEKRRNKLEDLS